MAGAEAVAGALLYAFDNLFGVTAVHDALCLPGKPPNGWWWTRLLPMVWYLVWQCPRLLTFSIKTIRGNWFLPLKLHCRQLPLLRFIPVRVGG